MSALPELPEIASVFTFADMRVALTNYGFECRKQALEEVALEFDRRSILIDGSLCTGWYEPSEPAEIIRKMK